MLGISLARLLAIIVFNLFENNDVIEPVKNAYYGIMEVLRNGFNIFIIGALMWQIIIEDIH